VELQAIGEPYNSNVLNILPVTTLRTIDLEGKENFDPLFSRFCAEMRVFLDRNGAPEGVHAEPGGMFCTCDVLG